MWRKRQKFRLRVTNRNVNEHHTIREEVHRVWSGFYELSIMFNIHKDTVLVFTCVRIEHFLKKQPLKQSGWRQHSQSASTVKQTEETMKMMLQKNWSAVSSVRKPTWVTTLNPKQVRGIKWWNRQNHRNRKREKVKVEINKRIKSIEDDQKTTSHQRSEEQRRSTLLWLKHNKVFLRLQQLLKRWLWQRVGSEPEPTTC